MGPQKQLQLQNLSLEKATDLRMNPDYVFYYVNLARFIVTLVVPFISLVYLNTNIYL